MCTCLLYCPTMTETLFEFVYTSVTLYWYILYKEDLLTLHSVKLWHLQAEAYQNQHSGIPFTKVLHFWDSWKNHYLDMETKYFCFWFVFQFQFSKRLTCLKIWIWHKALVWIKITWNWNNHTSTNLSRFNTY